SGRRSQNHNVGGGDGLFISVEAHELMVVRNFNLVLVLFRERTHSVVHMVLEHIGNRDKLYRSRGAQGLVSSTRDTTTATDECQYERAGTRRVRAALDAQSAQD